MYENVREVSVRVREVFHTHVTHIDANEGALQHHSSVLT